MLNLLLNVFFVFIPQGVICLVFVRIVMVPWVVAGVPGQNGVEGTLDFGGIDYRVLTCSSVSAVK